MSDVTWTEVPHLAGDFPDLVGRRVQVWGPDGSLLVRGQCRAWEAAAEELGDRLAVVQVLPEEALELSQGERAKARERARQGVAPLYVVRPGSTAQVAADA